MFIGHFGVALAAKRVAPKTSLGTLIFAAEFLDLIWPIFLLTGVEHVGIVPGITQVNALDFYDYPISHSLLAAVGWSLLVGGVYLLWRRYRRGAWVVGAVVLSHWVLDAIVHRPDLPLWPGSRTLIGLGLWNSWAGSIIVEVVIFGAGLWIYLITTRAVDGPGRIGVWALAAFVFFGWVSTLFAGPPPSVTSVAWGAMILWITVLWGAWADAHREVAFG